MAALFCATVRAPLTGIVLTIEMTGNYWMILPLIITCMTASIVAQGLGGKPIYTVLLKRTLDLAKAKEASMDAKPADVPRE
jgi:CIC family chloride channel protein